MVPVEKVLWIREKGRRKLEVTGNFLLLRRKELDFSFTQLPFLCLSPWGRRGRTRKWEGPFPAEVGLTHLDSQDCMEWPDCWPVIQSHRRLILHAVYVLCVGIRGTVTFHFCKSSTEVNVNRMVWSQNYSGGELVNWSLWICVGLRTPQQLTTLQKSRGKADSQGWNIWKWILKTFGRY